MIEFIKRRLDEDAKHWKRLWSMRFAIGFGALNGLVMGIGYFSDGLNWRALALLALNVIGYSVVAAARVYKQDGL